MPLSINVGLSRKASKDYQSTGFSINVTAELDQTLLARPEELQAQIDDLYRQADQAIARQVSAQAQSQPRQVSAEHFRSGGENRGQRSYRRNGDDRRDYRQGNGRSNGPRDYTRNGSSRPTGMTDSQRRAIESIARRLDLDPIAEVSQEFGWEFSRLTVREASTVIDYLKSLQPAPNNGSNGNGHNGNAQQADPQSANSPI